MNVRHLPEVIYNGAKSGFNYIGQTTKSSVCAFGKTAMKAGTYCLDIIKQLSQYIGSLTLSSFHATKHFMTHYTDTSMKFLNSHRQETITGAACISATLLGLLVWNLFFGASQTKAEPTPAKV